MTHGESSKKTKELLCQSLKTFMKKKPLGKITVSEIIADCKVNRKTFYYHFEDIYALLKWMLEQEAIEVVKQFDLMIDYEEAVLFVMDYVRDNAYILNCAYDSIGRDELKRFFFNDLYAIMHNLLVNCEEEYHIQIDEKSREFICNFLLEGTAGMLVNGFKEKGKYDRETVIKNIRFFVKSIPYILEHADENFNGIL